MSESEVFSQRPLFYLRRAESITRGNEPNENPDFEECAAVVRAAHARIADRLSRQLKLNKDDAAYVIHLIGSPPI